MVRGAQGERALTRKASLQDVYIVSAVRTPVGSFNGALKKVQAVDLGAQAAVAAVERAHLKPADVEEAYLGCVLQASVGQAPARQVVLRAGCPDTTEATTVNKVCASGMKAIALATQSIQLGARSIMLAGGMESMSNAPFCIPRGGLVFGDANVTDVILRDGLQDAESRMAMGSCADHTARQENVSREEQDTYALTSYDRATRAWENQAFAEELVPVTIRDPKLGDQTVLEDEEFRRVKREKVRTLRPAFDKDGTVTAANASSINDGASALVLASGEAVQARKLTPLTRVVATADAACAPIDFPIAPSLAVPQALQRAGISKEEVALWEINEAFSVVALANIKRLGLDPAKVNTLGGGVSLGHPIGSSGSRIVVTLVHALQPGQYGVASVCNVRGSTSVAWLTDRVAAAPRRLWCSACSGAHWLLAWPAESHRPKNCAWIAVHAPGANQRSVASSGTSTRARLHLAHASLSTRPPGPPPMPKRSLAEAFQASLAEERADEERRKEAKPGGDADDGAEDYMSDSLLERMQQQQDSDDPAARKRREQAEQAEAQRHADTDTTLGRRQLKGRMPLAGEREARESGMASNLFDRVTGGGSAGSGSQAAVQMMLAMGYKPGESLGSSEEKDVPRQEPIRPDQRWLPQTPADTHRLGIGHADLSRRIESAAQRAAEEKEAKLESLEEFRMRSASEAQQRHVEGVLRKARRICRELDEEAGVKYSPLWLDPTCFPPGHALYQAPSIRGENERGLEDAQALLAYALVGEEEGEGAEPKEAAQPEHAERNDTEEQPEETDGSSRASPKPGQSPAARRVDAERFCSLNVRHTPPDHADRAASRKTGTHAYPPERHLHILRLLWASLCQCRGARDRVPRLGRRGS